MNKKIDATLTTLRSLKPLVLNITNYVTMDFMANALLALGAAPMMSVCDDELEELIQLSKSVNINIGTLDSAFIERCHKTATLAKHYNKPVVLDPVGSGASRIRTQTAQHLMPYVDIVRGNASEILSLHQITSSTLGVEAIHTTQDATQSGIALAKQHGCTVVISGPVDFITDGTQHTEISLGSPVMSQITGMGCALTAVIAAFRGTSEDTFETAALATEYFGACGSHAAQSTTAPGTFRTLFLDALAQ